MHTKILFALAAGLAVTLTGCGGSDASKIGNVPHGDSPDVTITSGNALAIAADVYRAAAVDAPYTASIAMNDDGSINGAACTDSSAITGTMVMNGNLMGMDMNYTACVLTSSPTGHQITVDGDCSNMQNTDGSETVSGDAITFDAAMNPLTLHAFSVTRTAGDEMMRASGTLHRADGGIVTFRTTVDFSGPASAPTAGELEITGLNDSRMLLTIDNATNFTLKVDADGDGQYETTTQQTWDTDLWMSIP